MNKLFSLLLISISIGLAVSSYGSASYGSSSSNGGGSAGLIMPSADLSKFKENALVDSSSSSSSQSSSSTSTIVVESPVSELAQEKMTDIDALLAKVKPVTIASINIDEFDAKEVEKDTCDSNDGLYKHFFGNFGKFVVNVLNSNKDWLNGLTSLRENVVEINKNQVLLFSMLKDVSDILHEKPTKKITKVGGSAKSDNSGDISELKSALLTLAIQVKNLEEKFQANGQTSQVAQAAPSYSAQAPAAPAYSAQAPAAPAYSAQAPAAPAYSAQAPAAPAYSAQAPAPKAY